MDGRRRQRANTASSSRRPRSFRVSQSSTTIAVQTMPRGKPKNADYAGGPIPFKFSSIPQPVPYLNAKNVSSTYGKSDSQSWWTKRDDWDQRDSKRKRSWLQAETEVDEPMADVLKGKNKEVRIPQLRGGSRERDP
jgi:hypothetical protein